MSGEISLSLQFYVALVVHANIKISRADEISIRDDEGDPMDVSDNGFNHKHIPQ